MTSQSVAYINTYMYTLLKFTPRNKKLERNKKTKTRAPPFYRSPEKGSSYPHRSKGHNCVPSEGSYSLL